MNWELVGILSAGVLVGFFVLLSFLSNSRTTSATVALVGVIFGGAAVSFLKDTRHVENLYFYPVGILAGAIVAAVYYYAQGRPYERKGIIELNRTGQYEINYGVSFKTKPDLTLSILHPRKVSSTAHASWQITLQRTDGFEFEIKSYSLSTKLQWKAKGYKAEAA